LNEHHIFKRLNLKIFFMDILSKTDTTTFVLVMLLLFACYNIALFCWFRFFVKDGVKPSADKGLKEKFRERSDEAQQREELEDLPF